MLRRTLLQVPIAAAFAQKAAPKPSFKLSVRVEPLFKKMTLPEQMQKVAQARFHGFEFGNWRAADTALITP